MELETAPEPTTKTPDGWETVPVGDLGRVYGGLTGKSGRTSATAARATSRSST